jgi:hypothetical protein
VSKYIRNIHDEDCEDCEESDRYTLIGPLLNIVQEMREEAKALEEDTLTGMAEGIANSRIAYYLRIYADKFEAKCDEE